MICYFKLDRKNQPNLIFCSVAKTKSLEDNSVNIKEANMTISDHFELPATYKLKYTAIKPKMAIKGKKLPCLNC
jgi:hypothetical protein